MNERHWLVAELQTELQAKKKIRDYTIRKRSVTDAFYCLLAAFFLAPSGALGNIYWIPTFVKRLSGFSDRGVTALLIIPALIGIAGMLINGWHSDKRAERRLHAASTAALVGDDVWIGDPRRAQFCVSDFILAVGQRVLVCVLPVFWSIPTAILSESAAAATFGLINSIGQVGGFTGPT